MIVVSCRRRFFAGKSVPEAVAGKKGPVAKGRIQKNHPIALTKVSAWRSVNPEIIWKSFFRIFRL